MIYYVEDEENVRGLALYALTQAGHETLGFADASTFFDAMAQRLPDLILLDIMLPEVDGLEILKRVRSEERTRSIPVMMLTAKGTEFDTVVGLDAGADDYLTKPFGMMELVSRVNALLRRSSATEHSGEEMICGPICVSIPQHSVTVDGVSVQLTLKEFDLLCALMKHMGQVLTRDQLLESVWSMTYVGGTRTVDVHVQTLRQKLSEPCDDAGACIKTVRGVGYQMREASE